MQLQISLPNVVIAGTGRAGTTSLFRYLADHPSVCASSVKEVHFFDELSRDALGPEKLKTYESYFRHCPRGIPIRIEATPQYLYGGKRIAEAIASVIPDVKLIFTLREPIGRAFTVFRANRTRDPETFGQFSFDDFVAIGLDGESIGTSMSVRTRAERISILLSQGCYARPLSEYLEIFPLKQICIVFFDDFVKDVRMVMQHITEFLNIDFHFYDSYIFDVENRTRLYRSAHLHRFAYGINMKLERLLNRYPAARRVMRQVYNKINEREDDEEDISDLARQRLQQFYAPYNRALYALLTQNMPDSTLPEWIASASGS